jgi:creatinine amidohydrolase
MNTTVWMNQLSWVDYQQRIQTDHPPVLLPVGALEQHGPHLPLGTDGLLASAVAADTAARVGGLVAPTLSYGYKSQPKCGGGQHFCGTTSLDAATLIGQVRDAVREFARHGVDKLVVVNGHYENQWFLIEGIDLGLRDARAADAACALQVMRLEYWDFMTPETLGDVFPDGFPGFALEHAAVLETSMMLHHHPSWCAWTCCRTTARPTSRPTTCTRPAPTGCRPRACCRRPRVPTRSRESCWPTKWPAAWPTPSPPDSPAHDLPARLRPPGHRAHRHRHAARLLQPRRLRPPGRAGHRAHAGRGGPGEGPADRRARGRPARLPHARRPPARPVGLPAAKLARSVAAGAPIGSAGPLGRLLVRGEQGHDFVPELRPLSCEHVIDKPGYGAFHKTTLGALLGRLRHPPPAAVRRHHRGLRAFHLREAIDRGFVCTTVGDATAASQAELQAPALAMIGVEGGIFGGVCSTAEAVRAPRPAAREPGRRHDLTGSTCPRPTNPCPPPTAASGNAPCSKRPRAATPPPRCTGCRPRAGTPTCACPPAWTPPRPKAARCCRASAASPASRPAASGQPDVCTWHRRWDVQPPRSTPDAGYMVFEATDRVIETGVHGRYLEVWERLPGSTGLYAAQAELDAQGQPTGAMRFVAGRYTLTVRPRTRRLAGRSAARRDPGRAGAAPPRCCAGPAGFRAGVQRGAGLDWPSPPQARHAPDPRRRLV